MDVLAMILTGWTPSWIDRDRYLSLHTAEPTSQDEHEVQFEGYRRQPVSVTCWDRLEDSYTNRHTISFPISIGSETAPITHIAIGLAADGAGQILYTGRVRRPFRIRFNDRVEFQAGSLTIVEA